MKIVTLARDARDAFCAASLTFFFFGAPVALSLMALDRAVGTQLRVESSSERSAVFAFVMPTEEVPARDPATGRIDGVEATIKPLPPPPPELEPEPEPVFDEEELALAEASPLEEAPEGPRVGHRLARDFERVRIARPPRLASSKASAPRPPRKPRCEEPSGEIQKVDESTYAVARSLVDLYVRDLEKAQNLAYVAWHRNEEGKIDGFRIRRIKCGNVLDQAGFRNGDVVHSVNGKKIRTVFGAIAAYQRLKNKEQLRVDVTSEQGEGRQMKYRIS